MENCEIFFSVFVLQWAIISLTFNQWIQLFIILSFHDDYLVALIKLTEDDFLDFVLFSARYQTWHFWYSKWKLISKTSCMVSHKFGRSIGNIIFYEQLSSQFGLNFCVYKSFSSQPNIDCWKIYTFTTFKNGKFHFIHTQKTGVKFTTNPIIFMVHLTFFCFLLPLAPASSHWWRFIGQ